MNLDITDLMVSGGKTERLSGSLKVCIFSMIAPARQATSASTSHWLLGNRKTCALPARFLVMEKMKSTRWMNICCFPCVISNRSLQKPSASLGTPPSSHLELSNVSREKASGVQRFEQGKIEVRSGQGLVQFNRNYTIITH